jgi:hypothetical protein
MAEKKTMKKAEGTLKSIVFFSAINVAFSAKGLAKVGYKTTR